MIRRALSVFCLAALPALAQAATADDLSATSAIEAVLVFPESAEITRVGEIAIPAGDHRVLVAGLPRSVNSDSLRVRFGDEAIIVGAVEATEAFPAGGGPEQAQGLRDRLQELKDQVQAVDDRIATAELQLQFLASQASPAGRDSDPLGPQEWAAALRAIDVGAQAARQSMLAARQERRSLDRALAQVQLELDRWDDDLALRTDVAIALTAEAAVATAFVVEYQVEEAGWGALYEARLDSDAPSLALDRKIQVFQNSGEDWLGVRLSVTTAPRSDQLSAPHVGPQYLSLRAPAPPAPSPPPAPRAAAEATAFGQDDGAERILVTGSRIQLVDVVDAAFASAYAVGGLVDVASDATPRTFTVGQELLEPELVIRTAPRLSLDAFVTAKVTYEGDGPLPAGPLRLYRDGAYLREDYLGTLIPGEEVEIGFGVDESVLITWVDEGGLSSDVGIIGRSTEIQEDHRFEALNRHDRAFTVEIVDRRPIAQDDDITVRVSAESTAPAETGFMDEPGVVVWRRELAPGEALAVRNAYAIVHPSSRILIRR
jgi:uncharacterized protein (TIGR02231 family)